VHPQGSHIYIYIYIYRVDHLYIVSHYGTITETTNMRSNTSSSQNCKGAWSAVLVSSGVPFGLENLTLKQLEIRPIGLWRWYIDKTACLLFKAQGGQCSYLTGDTLPLHYNLMRSIGLWRWYIKMPVTVLNIIHWSCILLEQRVGNWIVSVWRCNLSEWPPVDWATSCFRRPVLGPTEWIPSEDGEGSQSCQLLRLRLVCI
jgi:hypothetical protein